MNTIRKLSPFCLVLLILFSYTASAGEMLRAGIATNYPPLAFKKDDRIIGIEADLAAALEKQLKREIALVELPWARLIPALKSGKIDLIMAGMSVTGERAQQVAFAEAYMTLGQMALIRIADVGRFATPAALYATSGRVGFSRRTTGEKFARAKLPNAKLMPMENTKRGVQALREERIDLFVHDAPTVWRVTSDPREKTLMGLYWNLTDEQLAWAVRKDDQALLEALSSAVREWKASGKLNGIVNRWIPLRVEVEQ